jgi:hypothetical protein
MINFPLNTDLTKALPNFEVSSDHNFLDTEDIIISSALKTAGWKDGQWVKISGSELVATDTSADRNSYCVYTGSETSTEPTPDTLASDKLTVIVNGFRGKTKEYTGTPPVGTLLVAKSGKLVAAADAGEERRAVAVVFKAIENGYLYFRAF